jgi:hypothetical protein
MGRSIEYMDASNSAVKERMFATLMPSLDDLVTWLQFFVRKSTLVMPNLPAYYGTSNALARVFTILQIGDAYLENNAACLHRIVSR